MSSATAKAPSLFGRLGQRLLPWESWIILRDGADGPVVSERRLRRHFSERGAQRWADSIAYSPEILAKTLETALRGTGTMVFADPEARRCP